MQGIKHYLAGEKALIEAHVALGLNALERATAMAQVAGAEFAAACAANHLAGPHRDPVLDAERDLPHARQQSTLGPLVEVKQ